MEFAAGNVFIREMEFAQAGGAINGHAHKFDHVSYVVRGALRFEQLDGKDGGVVRWVDKRALDGQNWVLIKAGVWHRIIALDGNSLGHCIYAHRTPQGRVVQKYDGWDKATF